MWPRLPFDRNRTSCVPGQARNLYAALLLSSVLATLLFSLIYLLHTPMVEFLNLRCTDIVVESGASFQKSETETKVLLVAIDDRSLQTFGQWPWPRYLLADLLQIIKEGGAAAIGVDILFPEKDRTSPITWQENLRNDFGYEIDTSRIPQEVLDHDIYLANVLSSGPFVLSNEFLFSTEQAVDNGCLLHPVSLIRKGKKRQTDKQLFHHADGVLCNYEILEKAAQASGFLNGNIDIDGNIRRLPLMVEFEGQFYPSFALAVLMQFYRVNVVVLEGIDKGLPLFSFKDLHIPTDEEANFFLGPLRPQGGRSVSANEVLAGNVDAEIFRNVIVLVGLTASGLTQQYPNPFSPAISLLELHKLAIASLASSGHTLRMDDFIYLEIAAGFLVSLGLALCIIGLAPLFSGAVAVILIALVWVAAILVYLNSGMLFSPLLPSIVVVFNFFLLISLKFKFFQVQARFEAGEALLLLKSSEDTLKSILKTIPDIVFRLDSQGRITFISPAVSKYVQNADRLVGRHVLELVDPEDRDKAECRLNERRTGDRATRDLEIKLLSHEIANNSKQKKVEQRYFSVSAEGIYSNGTADARIFIGTQGIAKDITNRKNLERQLIRAKKMEVVGNLAAGIAHDLNNILSGLVSYPDLLLLEIPETSPLYKKVQLIQKSGKKAATIVQDLLTLARRSVDLNTICNMNEIIHDYLKSVEFEKMKSNYPNIVIHQDLADNLFNIKGSMVHLSKVLMNIFHNAMEAMPAGGEITVATENKYVDIDINGYERIPQGEYVCTTISDNGVGIPGKDLQRMFEPFFTKKSMGRSGSGLGMTVIWATVKDHDGYLDILSQEGQGTVIRLYLPSTREDIDSRRRRVVLDDYTGSENILVVDDVEEQVEIASTMLRKLGYRVETAVSGAKALELVRRQSFDLLVLDMIMPGGLDGLETYEEIIRLYPQQKAIITSGYSASERVKRLQELGAGIYVQKPYSMEALGIAVRQELDTPEGTSAGP